VLSQEGVPQKKRDQMSNWRGVLEFWELKGWEGWTEVKACLAFNL